MQHRVMNDARAERKRERERVWSERECGVKERGRERKINREKDKLRERVGREERGAGRERKK
jgi:hypothetical protein